MTRYALIAAAAVALSTASPASAQQANISFNDALGIAQAQVSGGTLLKGRVESNKGGGVVYGFYFWIDGKMREIEISTAGEVFKDSNKTPDPISRDIAGLISAKGARAKLPDGRLAEIAAGALNGAPVTSMAFVRQGDQLLAQFGAVTLDASTGRVVSPPPK